MIISNALMGDGRRTDLFLTKGQLAERPSDEAEMFDAHGGLVLPGIVDLHGDGFERILEPRSGVSFSLSDALAETDRQLVANGITTAFHAITVSWETGLRSAKMAEQLFDAIKTGSFMADMFPHFRWETFALSAVGQVIDWLAAGSPMLVSLNDHTTANLNLVPPSAKLDRIAARLQISPDDVFSMLKRHAENKEKVPQAIKQVCAAALKNGVPLLAHDERCVEDRRFHRSLGVKISEFPITAEAAEEAASANETILLGAPNVVRGGSHTNAINAKWAIEAGICSVLVSDYYYPSLMQAMVKLADGNPMHMAEHWFLVSKAPALTAGLTDRGSIAPGLRGDLLVFWPESTDLRAVFVKGRKVLEYG